MSKTVLLIDYDPRSIAQIRRLLGQVGVRIELALDGRSGLEQAQRIRPVLTIVQDVLPLLDGLDLCRELKNSEDYRDLPVMILTGPRQHNALMRTKCDAYVEKPAKDEELLKVVVALLERPAESVRPTRRANVSADVPARTEPDMDGPHPVELTEADLDACLDEALASGTGTPAG